METVVYVQRRLTKSLFCNIVGGITVPPEKSENIYPGDTFVVPW